jgi:hypothetical protein
MSRRIAAIEPFDPAVVAVIKELEAAVDLVTRVHQI